MAQLVDPDRVWTVEELERWLPDDVDYDPRCFEIVDGTLIMSPPPDFYHEGVLDFLRATLRPQLPPELRMVGSGGVGFDTSYRVPDLLVVPSELIVQRRRRATPGEVRLAVEVVSPSSRTTDRVMKPAQYAAAGIGAYWRVETDPEVTLTAYVLDPGADVYSELGTWGPGQVAELDRPFAVRVEIDALIPTA
jgi:Uma2 family endonuclease